MLLHLFLIIYITRYNQRLPILNEKLSYSLSENFTIHILLNNIKKHFLLYDVFIGLFKKYIFQNLKTLHFSIIQLDMKLSDLLLPEL